MYPLPPSYITFPPAEGGASVLRGRQAGALWREQPAAAGGRAGASERAASWRESLPVVSECVAEQDGEMIFSDLYFALHIMWLVRSEGRNLCQNVWSGVTDEGAWHNHAAPCRRRSFATFLIGKNQGSGITRTERDWSTFYRELSSLVALYALKYDLSLGTF